MAKIFSILTVVLAGLALYLGLESGKRIKELQDAGKKTQGKLVVTEKNLKDTQDKLAETQTKLDQTEKDLESTRAELTKAKQDLTSAQSELTTAKDALAKANMELNTIKEEIEKVLPGAGLQGIGKLKDSITELTTKVKDQETAIGNLEKNKAELEATVTSLSKSVEEKTGEVAAKETTIKKYRDNIMQKGVSGRVMAVNAGWGFCVLSVGDRAGAAANKVMIVARNGQAIGKVRITNVEATQSVADIIPNSFVKGMYVQPGDQVIYTGEDKVKVEEPAATNAGGAALQPELPR